MRRDSLIAVILFAIALGTFLAHVDSTPFHRDEARWIHRARFVSQAADPLGPYWQDRELMRGQPPLGSYLTGIGLLAQGHDLDTNELYDFNHGDAWNRENGRVPTAEDLTAARRTNSVVGAFIVVAVYFIGRRLLNRVAGTIAALALIPHPLAIYLSSLAGSDALLTLFIVLATLAAMRLADHPTWPRAILLGVLLGLGGATKLSPLAVAVPLGGIGAVYLLWAWWPGRGSERTDWSALGWRLLSVPIVAFATFVAAYPYLWSDPIGRSRILFNFRAQEMDAQGRIWDHLDIANRTDALSRIGSWLGETHSTTGSIASWLAARLGVSWQPSGIDFLLTLIGAEMLIVLVVRHGLGSRHALAAAVLGAHVAAVALGMRADFERYLLPVLVMMAVCIGLVGGYVWVWALQVVTDRQTARHDETASATMPEMELPRQTVRA